MPAGKRSGPKAPRRRAPSRKEHTAKEPSATLPIDVQPGKIDEALRKVTETLRQWANAGRYTKVRFKFRGKAGIRHAIDLDDRRLAKIVKQCQDIPWWRPRASPSTGRGSSARCWSTWPAAASSTSSW
jgi:hypothetical protein